MERAVALLLVNPTGLKGLWLRARAGPVRERVTAALTPLSPRRLHPSIDDAALYGGMDLSATLATGEMQRHAGLLESGGALMLTMAERCPAGLAARLGQALDAQGDMCLIALDEGMDGDEVLPAALAERMALFVDLDAFGWSDTAPILPSPTAIAAARACLPALRPGPDMQARLTRVAAELGIASLRAPQLCAAAARANAALCARAEITDEDLQIAVALVYGHRAAPAAEAPPPQDDPPPPTPPEDDTPPPDDPDSDSLPDLPDDILLEAVRAALPPDLLAKLAGARAARAGKQAQSGAGGARKSRRRGRPLPSRPGKPGSGARVDVIATLRQAAPWQTIRRQNYPHLVASTDGDTQRLILLPGDIRIRHFRETTERVLIFVVDASGSAAMARLGEAKGAVELMLAEAYSSRDSVALIAFRGRDAELILPPTRSLVQAKRRLAGLPGGGATPLAHGLNMALEAAIAARGHGMTPTLALLSDGRGNIALDGSADRAQAATDATTLARAIASANISALVIDTSLRPQPALSDLAAAMGAQRIALPRVDARIMSSALTRALEA